MSGKHPGGADDFSNAAATTAASLLLQEEQRRGQALRDELEEAEELAILGLATRELLHDVANRLNQIMLQASILMMRYPQEVAADLKIIREEGLKAAERLAPLQQRGRLRRKEKKVLDLNRILQDLVMDELSLRDRLRLTLAPGLAALQARPGDVKRLLRLFFRGLFAEAGPDKSLNARTGALTTGRTELLVMDEARSIPSNALDQPFDSEDGLFAAADPIDRMAMQVLLRETGGSLQVRGGPQGGIEVRIEWSQGVAEPGAART